MCKCSENTLALNTVVLIPAPRLDKLARSLEEGPLCLQAEGCYVFGRAKALTIRSGNTVPSQAFFMIQVQYECQDVRASGRHDGVSYQKCYVWRYLKGRKIKSRGLYTGCRKDLRQLDASTSTSVHLSAQRLEQCLRADGMYGLGQWKSFGKHALDALRMRCSSEAR